MKKVIFSIAAVCLLFFCSCTKTVLETSETPSDPSLKAGDTFYSVFHCEMEGGRYGLECAKGRSQTCDLIKECSIGNSGVQAEISRYYSTDEIQQMILTNSPIDNQELLQWLKENSDLPIL